MVVSAELFALVERAVRAWKDTAGRYDPTVLPAVVAAGYDRDFDAVATEGAGPGTDVGTRTGSGMRRHRARRAPGRGHAPGRRRARPRRDRQGLRRRPRRRRSSSRRGARGALVNLGGDLRAVGAAPEPHGWVVAVDDPLATGSTGMLALREGAIATSTRLRRAWERDGQTLHHLIDPRTGRPAASGLASVTVVAGDAWRAEVLAKAAFVAGPADGGAVITGAGATGLLVHDDGRVVELEGLAAFRP